MTTLIPIPTRLVVDDIISVWGGAHHREIISLVDDLAPDRCFPTLDAWTYYAYEEVDEEVWLKVGIIEFV